MKLEKETRVQQDEIILLIICLYTSIAIWYTYIYTQIYIYIYIHSICVDRSTMIGSV